MLPTSTQPPAKVPLKERLTLLLSEYGPVAFAVWFALFGLTLGGFVLAIRMGFQPKGAAGGVGTFGAAYVATQLTKPLRIFATLALTPWVGRAVARWKERRTKR